MTDARITDRTSARLSEALAAGSRLHAFRSGGGLRVVRLEADKPMQSQARGMARMNGPEVLRGYGEHPHIEEALRIAGEDFVAGGRPYDKVYGVVEPKYLTGSTSPSSPLDTWVLAGNTIDAWQDGDSIVVGLMGYARVKMPPEVEAVAKDRPIEWKARGFVFWSGPTQFPNGDPGITTKVIWPAEQLAQKTAFSYLVVRRGSGPDFRAAVAAALAAEETDVQAGVNP